MWSIGYNMPGYLPESDPGIYESWEDARAALIEELERVASEAEGSEVIDIRLTIASLSNVSSGYTWGRYCAGYVYWLEFIAD